MSKKEIQKQSREKQIAKTENDTHKNGRDPKAETTNPGSYENYLESKIKSASILLDETQYNLGLQLIGGIKCKIRGINRGNDTITQDTFKVDLPGQKDLPKSKGVTEEDRQKFKKLFKLIEKIEKGLIQKFQAKIDKDEVSQFGPHRVKNEELKKDLEWFRKQFETYEKENTKYVIASDQIVRVSSLDSKPEKAIQRTFAKLIESPVIEKRSQRGRLGSDSSTVLTEISKKASTRAAQNIKKLPSL